jgi:dipeptidyl-peptidase-4
MIILLCPIILMAQNGASKISLDDVIKNYAFFPHTVYGIKSMNDGLHYTLATDGQSIVRYDYRTGKSVDTIVKLAVKGEKQPPSFDDYTFSRDESKILLTTAREPLYRHSFKAGYYVYTISSGELKPLSENGKQQLATFSPDASMVAFMRDNDLFIVNLETGEEEQITHDGRQDEVVNGAPDWVYEEEFSLVQAYDWSPDSKRLAYMRFDERNIPVYSMIMYEGMYPELKEYTLYPGVRSFRYPKAGEPNSIVTVHVYDLATGATYTMDTGDDTDQYIPRIKWTLRPETLCIYCMNRLQNRLELLAADAVSGKSRMFFTEENKYYIPEIHFDDLTFLKDDDHFIWVSERDGWYSLYLCSMTGSDVFRVTAGDYDVKQFYGIDEDKGLLYYQTSSVTPVRSEVYSIMIDGSHMTRLTPGEGSNSASFSKRFQYFVNDFSDYTTPNVITVCTSKGKEVRTLEDNQALRDKLKDYAYTTPQLFTFTTSEGIELNGSMLKPPAFDTSHRYPVLMSVYGGPDSQTVIDTWSFGWDNYLAQEGYIIVSVDGRGTGGRGEAFRKLTYLHMGKYETIDLTEAARYLGSLPYVDAGRIGVWGWSFGGYMTLMCLTKGDGLFKAGVAVAPVSNWRYYDNIYTERYMRTPQENPQGYDENAPINFVDAFKGKLLIIHGTADDNVHTQNTFEFTEHLVQADRDFKMLLYTNRNHGIYGGNTRTHLFRNITEFILNNI